MSTTTWKHQAVICVPEPLYPDFQELEGAWGTSMADHQIARSPMGTASDGTPVIVISVACTDTLVQRQASGIVERPEYDAEEAIDLVAAQRAADALVLAQPDEDGIWPAAGAGQVVIYLDVPSQVALGYAGVAGAEEPEEE